MCASDADRRSSSAGGEKNAREGEKDVKRGQERKNDGPNNYFEYSGSEEERQNVDFANEA